MKFLIDFGYNIIREGGWTMEKKEKTKGFCVIQCEAGNKSVPNMTKKDCMERARVSGCSSSWQSYQEMWAPRLSHKSFS